MATPKKAGRPPKDRSAQIAKFLLGLGDGLSVSGAARGADLALTTLYRDRDNDAAFKAAWDSAIETGTDALEDEVLRRAKDGTLKPVYQGGVKVGEIREFSDTLAIFLLKARRPEKFKDRAQVDLNATDGLVAAFSAAEKRMKG